MSWIIDWEKATLSREVEEWWMKVCGWSGWIKSGKRDRTTLVDVIYQYICSSKEE